MREGGKGDRGPNSCEELVMWGEGGEGGGVERVGQRKRLGREGGKSDRELNSCEELVMWAVG